MSVPGYRGRFAPSPTGDLHLGSAAAALVAWLRARAAGGTFVVRVEDVDAPRVVPGSETRQLDDLGVSHHAEEYRGNHYEMNWIDHGRVEDRMLPFFAKLLQFGEDAS